MVIKLYQPTPVELCFRARPSGWTIGLAILAAIVATIWLVPELVIHCRRVDQGKATCAAHRQLFGIPLSALARFNLCTAGGESLVRDWTRDDLPVALSLDDTCRPVLVASSSAQLITHRLYCGRRAHQRLVGDLEAFLVSPDPESTAAFTLPSSPWSRGVVGVFWLVALAGAFFSWTRCSLDHASARITVEKPGLLGLRRRTFRFAEVERFAIRQQANPNFDYEYGDLRAFPEELRPLETTLALVLVLKNAREVSIIENMFGGQRGLEVVRKLERFRTSRPPLALRRDERACPEGG
ncbi:MAG: hypothetical protein AB9869_32110 [Verrucomicrobiia bacterium]